MKGLFPSSIHWNFVGENETEGRRNLRVPDINMFFTSFILEYLLESQNIGLISIPKPVIELSIDAILKFQEEDSIYSFWKKNYDPKNGVYLNDENNFNNIFKYYGTFSKYILENQEKFKKLNILEQFTILTKGMERLGLTNLASIKDGDDISTCFAISYYLNLQKSLYPQVVETWNQQNSKKWNAINMILSYTYKPFSKNIDFNLINSASYYAIHPFLEQWKSKLSHSPKELKSLTLIPTWLSNISSQKFSVPYIHMPSNVNCIDLDVSLNVLLGILKVIRSEDRKGPIVLTHEIRNIFLSTSMVTEWALETRVIYKRPDITLLYYTSIQTFHHFLSRLVFFLEEFNFEESKINGNPFPKELEISLQILKNVSEDVVTKELLNSAKNNCEDVYWESFLGNADTVNGSKTQYGEDRFFSTALAINSLIDIWTVPSVNGKNRIWKPNTPDQVKSVTNSSSLYLNDNILKDHIKSSGPFFTFYPNTLENDRFRYPSNYCMYFNGTTCNPNQKLLEPWKIISGISGVVSEQDYKTMLSQKWAGLPIPTEFKGYNFYPIPYFESEIYTYSISLLALSKYAITL
eukprot:gene6800-8437_t